MSAPISVYKRSTVRLNSHVCVCGHVLFMLFVFIVIAVDVHVVSATSGDDTPYYNGVYL